MTPRRFMLIAGEPSGDMLAAELVTQLKSTISRQSSYATDVQPLRADLAPRFFGAGGPRMMGAGVELAFDMTQHSVIGLTDVLKNALKFRRLFQQLFHVALERQPHAIICVDFFGFNGRFANYVMNYIREQEGTFNNWHPKIIQFVSPQVWASREGRADKMARNFDLLLSIFPFEKDWYAARLPKFPVEFVGHPMIDRYRLSPEFTPKSDPPGVPPGPLILLLPGSRPAELERHLPVMFGAVRILRRTVPDARIRLVVPLPELVDQAAGFLPPPDLETRCGGLAESLSEATLALASTGTVTMECAYFGVPAVTLYKTSLFNYQVAKRIVKVKWLTMPNILADAPLYPEFIQGAASAENIARAALDLLKDAARREKVRARLGEIVSTLGGPGAACRAAEAIMKVVG